MALNELNNAPTVQNEPSTASAIQNEPNNVPSADVSADVIPSQPINNNVNVINPEGSLVSISADQLADALTNGYTQASPEHIAEYAKQQKYGTPGQVGKAALEGVAQGIAGPLAPAIETQALGVKPEDIAGREEVNPVAHFGSEMLGLAGSMLTGEGEGALASHVGEAASKALGLEGGAGAASKIGSAATKAAIENMIITGGDETSKLFSEQTDPNTPVQSALINVGLSGLIGGGAGGLLGSVSPIWKAAFGNKTGGVLQALTDKLGGAEGNAGITPAVPTEIDTALSKLGINDIAPEIKSSLSDNDAVRQMATVLNQTDTNPSGLAYQQARKNFVSQLQESMVKSLGKDASTLSDEFSEAAHGQNIGTTLADEYNTTVDPVKKGFEDAKVKYGKAELTPSISDKVAASQETQDKLVTQLTKASKDLQSALDSSSVEKAVSTSAKVDELQTAIRNLGNATKAPGTSDVIADEISKLVEKEAWGGSEDIMKEVNRVMKKLPELKTVGDLQKEMITIGNNTRSKLPFGMQDPTSRMGGMIKSIFRDAEANSVGKAIGSEEGVDALSKFNANRKAFASVAKLKDALDDRLGIHGSVSNYGKGIKEMARTDGEKVLRRLSGKGDADVLSLLQTNFPKTAQALREAHIDQLLAKASRAAKGDSIINTTTLSKSIGDLSPEVRNFIASPETRGKIDAVDKILTRLNDPNHNYSNTARTAEKLLSHLPGSAVAAASMLMGHNPAIGLLLGGLTKMVSKDAPDAVRLAALKFLGSTNHVEPGAFKAAVDLIRATARGESMLARGSKAVFTAGKEVLPETQFPTEKDRERLDKQVKALTLDPKPLEDVGNETAHYMPGHGSAMAQTATSAVNYLSQLIPNTGKANPLDSKPVLSTTQKASYNRALDIAIQPMVVLDKVQKGSITPQDITHLRGLYPNMYDNMAQKLTNEVIETSNKGGRVPYKTRIGLSMFLGQPMDSTMTPQAIIAAQPKGNQQPAPSGTPTGSPKHSTTALSKLPGMYQTSRQASEARRQSES